MKLRTLCVLFLLLMPATAFAHGGRWTPPPPTPLRPPTDAKPGTPLPGGPGAPQGLPPAPPRPSPPVAPESAEHAELQAWLRFNRERILGLTELRGKRRHALLSGTSQGEDDLDSKKREIARAAAIAALVVQIRSADTELSTAAIVALGRARSAAAVPQLSELARTKEIDSTMRESALLSLGLIGEAPPQVAERLRVALLDSAIPSRDRQFTALAIGLLGESSGVHLLAKLAQDASTPKELRCTAAYSLGLSGESIMAPVLRELIHSGNDALAAHAAAALTRLGTQGGKSDLLYLLERGGLHSRRQAALSLGLIPDPEVIAALKATTETVSFGDPVLRSYSALSLAESGREEAFGPILSAYRTGQPLTAAHAAIALGLLAQRTPDEELQISIRRLLLQQVAELGDSELGKHAILAAALAGAADATQEIETRLDTGSAHGIKGAAAIALALLGVRDCLPRIEKLILESGDPDQLQDAICAYRLMSPGAIDRILLHLIQNGRTETIRCTAAASMDAAASCRAISTLTTIVKDASRSSPERAAAAIALGHAIADEDIDAIAALGSRFELHMGNPAIMEALSWY